MPTTLAIAQFPYRGGRFPSEGDIRINDKWRWVAQNIPGGKCKIRHVLNIISNIQKVQKD